MKLYKCKVRLHANANDEVRKKNVTAAEIRLLRAMHGEDAVIEIQDCGVIERGEAEERDRLGKLYGDAAVVKLFGAPVVKVDMPLDPTAEIETPQPAPILPVGERVAPEVVAAQAQKTASELFE